MKYYERKITKRESINRFGKMGYVAYVEYVKTNDISSYNKGKRVYFEESVNARKYLYHLEIDRIYTEKAN